MKNFQQLFEGRKDAHGHYFSLAGRKRTERGKIVSKADTLKEKVTPELWNKHIEGKDRLGIIPVMTNGMVNWFVIDVDFYENVEHEKIAQAIKDAALPLVMTKSKSGGAHLWCFLEKPMDAEAAHKAAEKFNAKLGLADILGVSEAEYKQHVDIFPKDYNPKNTGSWVNIPYFGDACHAYPDMPFADFVKYANDHIAREVDLDFVASKKQGKTKKVKSDLPPCIEFMEREGVTEGHRDMALTHYCVLAKQKWPDEWEDHVREWNETHMETPLRADEVNKIIKSAGAKDFFYLCNAIKDIYCDKDECKKRTYGVGKSAPISDIGIEHIEKIDGEQPIYLVTIGGKTFDVNLDTIFTYVNFRKRAMGRLNRLLPPMKQSAWEDMLYEHLEMMEVTEAATDTQMRDRVIKSFQQWCGQCCVTGDFEDAMTAKSPFYDGKTIVFSGDALLSQLDRQLRVDRDQAYVYMRDWGTIMTERTDKAGKKYSLWCYVQKGPLWFDPYKGQQK